MAEANGEEQDIFYVCEKALKDAKEKLGKKEETTTGLVQKIAFPDDIDDDEIMVPVDMRGVEKIEEDERPKPMTAAEWRNVLGEGDEDDLLLEGEEEEFLDCGEDLEEEGDLEEDEEDDAEEPAAKKAK